MPSLIPGYEYDIFISYRHKDNKTGWVTEFVEHLKEELEATFKEDVSIYFDSNAHDGLLENHNVDKSLEGKIRSVIFIPILSQTYCDTKSFAWQHEFLAFNYLSSRDQYGRDIRLRTGNVASRILPIRIHDLDPEDQKLLEDELKGVLRPIDFIYKEPGVGRPLLSADNEDKNLNKTKYLNQINKVAHAVKDVITAMKQPRPLEREVHAASVSVERKPALFSKKVLLSIALLIVLVSAAIGVTTLLGDKTIVEETTERSIAVLPFANLSSDKEQEYFSDGLSEELLNLLAKIQDLKVISRTSAFSFKGKNEDIRTIGQKLGVAYLLEGSVRKSDDKVRITAQLIKASDGSHVWSETFDRNLNDIFKIQDEIANAVVAALKVKLLGTNSIAARQSNPDVYNLILQSKFYQNLGTRDAYRKATSYAQQAVALDPADARAMSELARCYSEESNISDEPEVAKEYLAKAILTAKKAIQLDPNLSEAYGTYARVLGFDWQFQESEQNFQRALDLDPANANATRQMALLQMNLGKFFQSEQLLKKAISIDPIRAGSYANLGLLYVCLERYDEAERQFLKGIELGPQPTVYWHYASMNLLRGDKVKSLEAVNKIDDPFWQDQGRLLWLWKYGDKAKFEKKLKAFETEYETVGAYQVAEIYAWQGNFDKAFHWLELAYKYHDAGLTEIKASMMLKPLQHDPRYRAMLEKLKLPL